MQTIKISRLLCLIALSMVLMISGCGEISSSGNGEDSDGEDISEEDQLNNKIVFTSQKNESITIYKVDPNGENVQQLTTDPGVEGFADISPNGTKIAFHRDTDTQDNEIDEQIFTMDIHGENQKQIISQNGEQKNTIPVWSPNGDKIAFTRVEPKEVGSEEYVRDIYIMDTDGSNIQQITDMQGNETASDWSPDGDKIIFSRDPVDENSDSELFTVNIDNGETTQLTDNSVSENRARYSPDGSQIAFSRRDGDRMDIFLMSTENGERQQLTDHPINDLEASWSPDGSKIVFWRYGDTHQIMKMNADGSDSPTQIAEGYEPVWSPVE